MGIRTELKSNFSSSVIFYNIVLLLSLFLALLPSPPYNFHEPFYCSHFSLSAFFLADKATLFPFFSSSKFIDIHSAVTLSLSLFLALLHSPPYHFHKPFYCSHFSLSPFFLADKATLFSKFFLLQFHSNPHKSLCILDFTRTYPLCKNPFFTFPASYIRILWSENVPCAILFQFPSGNKPSLFPSFPFLFSS